MSSRSGSSQSLVVGIDLGGTILRAGVFNSQGGILAVQQTEIEARQGFESGLERIAAVVETALGEARQKQPAGALTGIGVGSTGPLDSQRGLIQNPYTLPTWEDVPIVACLEERFGVPVRLENDADVAALGEYWRGAGQNVDRLYALTVGTGVGTACIIDGQIYRGMGGFHPEGGHMSIDPSGPLCYCGLHGCLESLASGSAISRQARQWLQAGGEGGGSILLELARGDPTRIEAQLVAQAARQGDPLAQRVIERAAHYLALGVANIVMLFFPRMIVLSGGVMKSADLFLPALQRAVLSVEHYIPAGQVRIAQAQLGYHAGIYGAAYAILQEVEGQA